MPMTNASEADRVDEDDESFPNLTSDKGPDGTWATLGAASLVTAMCEHGKGKSREAAKRTRN